MADVANMMRVNTMRAEIDMSAQLLGLESKELLDALAVARDVRLEESFAAEELEAIQHKFEVDYGTTYGSSIVYPDNGVIGNTVKEQKQTELIEETIGMTYEELLDLRKKVSMRAGTEHEAERYHEASRKIHALYGREDEISEYVERQLLLSKLAGWISFLASVEDIAEFDLRAFIDDATKDVDTRVSDKLEEEYAEAVLYGDHQRADQDGNLPKLFVAGTVRSMLEKPYKGVISQRSSSTNSGTETSS